MAAAVMAAIMVTTVMMVVMMGRHVVGTPVSTPIGAAARIVIGVIAGRVITSTPCRHKRNREGAYQ